jgi:isoquinoline 1-oxidoreductase
MKSPNPEPVGRALLPDERLEVGIYSSPEQTLTARDLGLVLQGPIETVNYAFDLDLAPTRRTFVQVLGAGLFIVVAADGTSAQERRGGGGGRGAPAPRNVAARVHIAPDGTVTVLTGKVEGGQGSRAQITQAAAEELRLTPEKVSLVMADTAAVPDDGITAGSRTTPSTLPAVRQGCAAARNLLTVAAAKQWNVEPNTVEFRDGKARHAASNREITLGELAKSEEVIKSFARVMPTDVTVTPVADWNVMGKSFSRPNARDLVTGAHQYPSDVTPPGTRYGKVLRAPSYGAKLTSVDVAQAKSMKDVIVVQDAQLVGVVAPTTFDAEQALESLKKSASWEPAPHPASSQLYQHLKDRARGGVPANPFADKVASAKKSLKQSYNVAYVQHAPMEPRAAVAEWTDGALTVWTATQNPFGVRGELQRAFQLPPEKVRVIVPDFGGGFGGKHSGECAVECARLALAAGKPVKLRWTREEEFTWAYFRPAAVIEAEASLDDAGTITSWYFININSGGSSIESPYKVGSAKTQFIQSEPPLRHGSYRALAATANSFAREVFMDELAEAAGMDPLAFRLKHLENARLRAVLESAAERFDFASRYKKKQPNVGVGLACSIEKSSYVAACAEVAVDRDKGTITVRHVAQSYDCGKIVNPGGLKSQVEGSIIMGLGPALGEEMQFENGTMLNASFRRYPVPRFSDVPKLDIHLLDRPDQPSVGGSETPIIAIAPAVANAVFHATGTRIRQMPIRLPTTA